MPTPANPKLTNPNRRLGFLIIEYLTKLGILNYMKKLKSMLIHSIQNQVHIRADLLSRHINKMVVNI